MAGCQQQATLPGCLATPAKLANMEPDTRTIYSRAHSMAAASIRIGDLVQTAHGWVVADVVGIKEDVVIVQHGEKTTIFPRGGQVVLRMADDV